ncbi:PREDICTED: retinol dehydrogenase 14-like [Priapulus caudatus]|uniref:Retinol dehydrogenase 14-like n=1 Tax=Priapulus caudatus TaxID=37621 RepID=A0ABM1DN54_PRICU|nr:PREDICTED: retinol dehydrogenase 14-like [Priapulus caudatus]
MMSYLVPFLGVGVAVALSLWLIRQYRNYTITIYLSSVTMEGKTVIITGANSGIGKATATELAARGARVIMAVRDLESGRQAIADIRERTAAGELLLKRLDLASLACVRAFCADVLATEPRIDVLVNNAGVYGGPATTTEDGFEYNLAVNHLGHFLLTRLLTERLVESAPSRVIVVTSSLYRKGIVDFDNLNMVGAYNPAKAYKNSKLMNSLFGRELHRRTCERGVSTYLVHPGIVWSGLARRVNTPRIIRLLFRPLGLALLKTPFQGCQTSVFCAVDKSIEGVSGKYYGNCREEPLDSKALDSDVTKRLWEVSEKLTGC